MIHKKNKLATILLLLTTIAYGQPNKYFFSFQIDSIIKNDPSPYKYQFAATYYSFIGEYKKSLEVRDNEYNSIPANEPTQSERDFFSKCTAIHAKEAILKEAAKTSIVIVNEAHHIALHRSYMKSLLKDLNKLGYTYLGLETLSDTDTLINQRKYPILSSGYYSQEPSFGNFIREAIENGFTVFRYEKKFEDSTQSKLDRELAQALNIQQVINKNPAAKFIIFCGHGHIFEDTFKSAIGLPMAGRVKQLTGIDPFTIDQTYLAEGWTVVNRFRKLMNETYDCLFIDSSKNYFNKASSPKMVDCNLYHPNTTYINDRPSWLLNSKTKFVGLNNKINIGYPCLVKIYLATDNKELAVPIDIIELKSKNDKKKSLVYKHKRQTAIVINNKGDKQTIEIK